MSKKSVLLRDYGSWLDECDIAKKVINVEDYILKMYGGIKKGVGIVDDVTMDALIDVLRVLDSKSPLLDERWVIRKDSVDFSEELDSMLLKNPIYTVPVVNSVSDSYVGLFKENLYNYPMSVVSTVSVKGCRVRVIYKDGVIVKATTKDLGGSGDITSQVISILGKKKKGLKDCGLVELRGKVVLPVTNIDKVGDYVSDSEGTLSKIYSLLGKGVSKEGVSLLDIVFTDILGTDFKFSELTSKYKVLERLGFNPPLSIVTEVEKYSFDDDLVRIVGKLEVHCEGYPYVTEGVLVRLNELSALKQSGIKEGYYLGEFLLRMGDWSVKAFKGVVSDIKWVDNYGVKMPIVYLEDSVEVAKGVFIDNLNLYAPCYLLMLEAYKGKEVYFRYIGKSGVVPALKSGDVVVDRTKN